jgi:hypothetical protein
MAAERETISLIGSDKVQGTAVYGADGEKIGAIERVREGILCRVEFRRLPRHWRRPLSATLAFAEIQR